MISTLSNTTGPIKFSYTTTTFDQALTDQPILDQSSNLMPILQSAQQMQI